MVSESESGHAYAVRLAAGDMMHVVPYSYNGRVIRVTTNVK